MPASRGWLCLLVLAASPAAAIEISTGFLIGASYDPRAFYVRAGAEAEWRKTNTGPEYRKTAQGKLIGVALAGTAEIGPALSPGVGLISLPLQSAGHSAFDSRGALLPDFLEELGGKLSAANEAGIAVELVLFDPARDEEFFSTDSILDAARNLTDWLIREDHRNVILNFAGDWTAPGWDFGNWIPLHFEQLADCVRTRFHDQRAGYTPPIALSVSVRMPEDAALINAADLLFLSGEALALDPRKIERPAVVAGSQACALGFSRLAGCVLAEAGDAAPIAPLLFSKPPRAR
jgi:hypothetical protein